MYNKKLCLNSGAAYGDDAKKSIELFKRVGFEGIFMNYADGSPVEDWARAAKKENMLIQSLHAPFMTIDSLWRENDSRTADTIRVINDCIDNCAKFDIPLVVCHAFIGFKDHPKITDMGLENFGRLIKNAEQKGVKIAFENTEGEEYLAAILNEFKGNSVGFCLDTGHELCYNYGKDLLKLYGNRLLGTHINDNLGISDYNGKIFWTDDLHLLPFDGIIDWKNFADRIKKIAFSGPLTFELKKRSIKGRHENDVYERMSVEDYITACYMRACRVASEIK